MNDIEAIARLDEIFLSKEWIGQDEDRYAYNCLCALLQNVSNEQKDLLIELTERYKWIALREYTSMLLNAFDQVECDKLENIKRIILFPIHDPKDEDRTKSGNFVLYMLKSCSMITKLRYSLSKYNGIYFQEIETFDDLYKESFSFNNSELIFLIDDFLGSGETLDATLKAIYRDKFISKSIVNIIAVASQLDSIDYCIKNQLPFYTECIEGKAITDHYNSEDAQKNKDLMEDIERLIPKNKHKFGYNQSEAIITLLRTPNNTFPIFWKPHKKNQQLFYPPFPRD